MEYSGKPFNLFMYICIYVCIFKHLVAQTKTFPGRRKLRLTNGYLAILTGPLSMFFTVQYMYFFTIRQSFSVSDAVMYLTHCISASTYALICGSLESHSACWSWKMAVDFCFSLMPQMFYFPPFKNHTHTVKHKHLFSDVQL